LVVVTVGALVVVEGCAHDAETLFTGPVPGGTKAEAGVPAGTFTLNVSVWPVSSVTVTVHSSAEAVGIAARPSVASTELTATTAIFSLRLLDTSADSSRHVRVQWAFAALTRRHGMGS
jgi:hypothetical protein